MKTNKKTIQSAMDARLSFLDELPSCRAAVQRRIAQEEEPVMKKKLSLGLVFAVVLVLLTAAALAATLLLSPRAGAVRLADQALEEKYGITAEMQTFLAREEKELPDGAVEVTYSGFAETEYVLGVYTAVVKDGKAEITWNRDGEDISGGYDADAWGLPQLKQMTEDSRNDVLKQKYLDRAMAIAKEHDAFRDDDVSSEADENYFNEIEARKTAALKARKISEKEMIAVGREFIISNYGLNEEQAARMELYTNFQAQVENGNGETEIIEAGDNGWYDMINGKPCFMVEYLLYSHAEVPEQEGLDETVKWPFEEKDGYYVVYVNVETGEIEEYVYNSGLAGQG